MKGWQGAWALSHKAEGVDEADVGLLHAHVAYEAPYWGEGEEEYWRRGPGIRWLESHCKASFILHTNKIDALALKFFSCPA